jgi:predicted nucleotidyltransferase
VIKIEPIIASLVDNEVAFVIIGGVAITHYGSAYVTQDFDFCYLRSAENIRRIVKAMSRFNPRLRNFPTDLPFIFDKATLQNGTNFTFDTDIGDIDLLGEVAGVGTYPEVEKTSVEIEMFGRPVKIISLEGLIDAKRAAGRVKDLLVLPELEALLELQNEEKEEAGN